MNGERFWKISFCFTHKYLIGKKFRNKMYFFRRILTTIIISREGGVIYTHPNKSAFFVRKSPIFCSNGQCCYYIMTLYYCIQWEQHFSLPQFAINSTAKRTIYFLISYVIFFVNQRNFLLQSYLDQQQRWIW